MHGVLSWFLAHRPQHEETVSVTALGVHRGVRLVTNMRSVFVLFWGFFWRGRRDRCIVCSPLLSGDAKSPRRETPTLETKNAINQRGTKSPSVRYYPIGAFTWSQNP